MKDEKKRVPNNDYKKEISPKKTKLENEEITTSYQEASNLIESIKFDSFDDGKTDGNSETSFTYSTPISITDANSRMTLEKEKKDLSTELNQVQELLELTKNHAAIIKAKNYNLEVAKKALEDELLRVREENRALSNDKKALENDLLRSYEVNKSLSNNNNILSKTNEALSETNEALLLDNQNLLKSNREIKRKYEDLVSHHEVTSENAKAGLGACDVVLNNDNKFDSALRNLKQHPDFPCLEAITRLHFRLPPSNEEVEKLMTEHSKEVYGVKNNEDRAPSKAFTPTNSFQNNNDQNRLR